MAAALLHEPETLFLDEPTSGADPLARREFWRRITRLAEQGVTVVVTTHFMEEAEYCDQVAILDEGKVLAQGTPAEIRQRGQTSDGAESSMEQAFIRIIEKGRQAELRCPLVLKSPRERHPHRTSQRHSLASRCYRGKDRGGSSGAAIVSPATRISGEGEPADPS